MTARAARIVYLVSGNGSNFAAIHEQIEAGTLAAQSVAVIANRPNAAALERATLAGIPTHCIDHQDFPDRLSFDRRLQAEIEDMQADLVVLAGFMRILTAEFVEAFSGRLVNIHPSLLPAFPGLNTHQRALQAHSTRHGASVHFVTTALDGGPCIVQAAVPVLPADTADTLAARVLVQEHLIYPMAVEWFAEARLRMEDDSVFLDGQKLGPTGVYLGTDWTAYGS